VHALYSLRPTLQLCITWTVSQTSTLTEYRLASSTHFYVSLEWCLRRQLTSSADVRRVESLSTPCMRWQMFSRTLLLVPSTPTVTYPSIVCMRPQMASAGSRLHWSHQSGLLKHFRVPRAALSIGEGVYTCMASTWIRYLSCMPRRDAGKTIQPYMLKISVAEHAETCKMFSACLCSLQPYVSRVSSYFHFMILLGAKAEEKLLCVTQTQRSKWCCLTQTSLFVMKSILKLINTLWTLHADKQPLYLYQLQR
jgi:hypothetical protein